MNNNLSEYKIFNDLALRKIEQVYSLNNASFTTKAAIFDLNPNIDFQYADFSGVDFSNSDLRNFNFTGSNLSNTTGVNCKYDSTTLLDGCKLENSPFAYGVEKRKLLESKVVLKKYNSLMNSDIFERSSFILTGIHGVEAKNLAKMILHDDESTVTQTSALYAMADFIKSENEFLEYAKSILNFRYESTPILTALLRAISTRFKNNQKVKTIIFHMLSDTRTEVAVSALSNLTRLTDPEVRQVADEVLGDSWASHRRKLCLKNGMKYSPFICIDQPGYADGYVENKKFVPAFIDPVIPLSSKILDTVHFYSLDDFMISVANDKRKLMSLRKSDKKTAEKIESQLDNLYNGPINITNNEGRKRYFSEVYNRSNIKYLMSSGMLERYKLKKLYSENPKSAGLKMPDLFNKMNKVVQKIESRKA